MSSLYISLFSSRYKVTSCINLSNSFRFPENGFGGFIFSSVGFAAITWVTVGSGPNGFGPISWSDGPPSSDIVLRSSSGSGFGFVCSMSASKSRSVGSVNTGAVVKLS